jgi:hypothetical protein
MFNKEKGVIREPCRLLALTIRQSIFVLDFRLKSVAILAIKQRTLAAQARGTMSSTTHVNDKSISANFEIPALCFEFHFIPLV